MSDNDVAEIDPPVAFDKWAPVAAEMLQRNSAERLEILRRHSLTPEDWTPSDAHWSAVLALEITAGNHARADIYALHCATEFKARREQSAPVQPVRDVKPEEVTAAKAISTAAVVEDEPPVINAPPPLAYVPVHAPNEVPYMPAEVPAMPPLGYGAKDTESDTKPPMYNPVIPNPVLPKPVAPNALQGTSWSLDIPRGPSLPFVPPSASGDSAASIAKPAEQVQRPMPPLAGNSLNETTDMADLHKIVRQIMPFKGDAAAKAAPAPAATSTSSAPVAKAVPPVVVPPVTPAAPERVEVKPAPTAVATTEPEWTLEQYASLCAELEIAPERMHETLHRYRVRPDQKAQLDALWGARIRADRALHAAFHHAKTTYTAWLMGAGRGS